MLFKFRYGEEMICEATKVEGGWRVQNTAALMPVENFQWHLVTWMPYTAIKDGFFLPESEVWFTAPLANDMEEYYSKWKKALLKGVQRVDPDGVEYED